MKPRTYTYRIGAWAGYVAGVWAFVFAAVSAYWAAGGILGLDAVSPEIVVLSENSWFVPLLWGVVVAKVLLGLLALALVQSWGRLVPGWILLTAAWGAGGLMVLHGGSNLLVRGSHGGRCDCHPTVHALDDSLLVPSVLGPVVPCRGDIVLCGGLALLENGA